MAYPKETIPRPNTTDSVRTTAAASPNACIHAESNP